MKLTILGATGSVGQELVNLALAAGHTVTVVVRNPEKLGAQSARVTIVQGDVTNAEVITNAITGSDAVLSALGHTKGSPDNILAVATSNVIKAMKHEHVQRLVVLANTSLPDANDHPTFGQRAQNSMMGMMMGKINQDHAAQAQLISDSGLDWTITRAAMLSSKPHSGKYRVGQLDSNAGGSIARADVADFMLTSVTTSKYIRSMPVVSQ